MISEQTSYVSAFPLLGAITIAMIGTIFFHRHHPKQIKDRKRAPSYTMGMGTSGGGMYFSGAMRCPKCRSDMELITIDGTEVDRFSSCYGLWFDDGELSSKEATASVSDFFKRLVTPARNWRRRVDTPSFHAARVT